MKRCLAVVLVIAATAMADMVITTKEVFKGDIVDADSIAVRMRVPTGGVQMVSVADIFEIRAADQKKADWLTVVLPRVKVELDVRAELPPPQIQPDLVPDEVNRRDPVGTGRVMIEGGIGFSSYSSGGASMTNFTLSPAVTLFVARGIGLGLDLSVNSTSVGQTSVATSAFGPKVVATLGPRGGSSYFLAEIGVALTGQTGSSGGDRTWVGIGYLPVVGGHLGLPLTLTVHVDHLGQSRVTTWLLGLGLCGLL